MARWKLGVLVVGLLFVSGGVGAGSVLVGKFVENDDSLSAQQPKLEYQIFSTNETAIHTHVGGDKITDKRNTDGDVPTLSVRVTVCPKHQKEKRPVNATIEYNDQTSPAGLWASVNRPAVSWFPIVEGESIRVLGDGNDADGDGTAGIKQGDRIHVFSQLLRARWRGACQ